MKHEEKQKERQRQRDTERTEECFSTYSNAENNDSFT